MDLDVATASLIAAEAALEDGTAAGDGERQRVVAGYNEDDCRATLALRDWVEERRAELSLRSTFYLAGSCRGVGDAVGHGNAESHVASRGVRARRVTDLMLVGLPTEPDRPGMNLGDRRREVSLVVGEEPVGAHPTAVAMWVASAAFGMRIWYPGTIFLVER